MSRVLDLDLIALGEVISRSEALTLPHPRAAQRDFVLQPIVEIWPDYRLPGFEGIRQRAARSVGEQPTSILGMRLTIERWIDRWASTAL